MEGGKCEALLLLSRIATSFPEGAADGERAGWKNLDQYKVGAPSIVVRADVAKSTETSTPPVTADPAQLNQSLGAIERRLTGKQSLTEGDKRLYDTVRAMRAF